ncbi:hypothetical protein FQA39_LY16578 [Lamprigera yunnana]|nr:hypothetical protein FQA39_LY16578 [Lamprigera yunnana]
MQAHEDEEQHIQEDFAIPGTSSGFQNIMEEIILDGICDSDIPSSSFREKNYDILEWRLIDSAIRDEIIIRGPEVLSIENMSKTDDVSKDINISYHREYSERLSSPMTLASDPIRNVDNFTKTFTLQRND